MRGKQLAPGGHIGSFKPGSILRTCEEIGGNDGLGESVQTVEGVTSLNEAGVEAQGILIVADGVGDAAGLLQGGGQGQMGLSVIGPETDGLFPMTDRIGPLALSGEGETQVVMRLWIVGFTAQGQLILVDGIGELIPAQEETAQVIVGVGVVGVDLEGLLVLAEGIVGPALPLPSGRQKEVGLGEFGFGLEGEMVLGDGVRDLAELRQGVSEIAARLGEVRFHLDDRHEMADGLREGADPGEGDSEIVVGLGEVALDAQGLPVLVDGGGDGAGLHEGGAEVIAGLGVIRIEAESLLVVIDGLRQEAAFLSDEAEIVIGDKGVWIFGQRIAPERFAGGIDGGAVPRGECEQQEEGDADGAGEGAGRWGDTPGDGDGSGGHESGDAGDGVVLPVIGDQGVTVESLIEEAEHGQEHGGEVTEAEQQRATPGSAVAPEEEEHRDERGVRDIPSPGRRGDAPFRINDHEVDRQERLDEIKPQGGSGGEESREEAGGEDTRAAQPALILEPDRHWSGDQREGEEGHGGEDVFGAERAASPPEAQQQGDRQQEDGGFTEQRESESGERQTVPQPAVRLVKSQVEEGSHQAEQHGQGVLLFGDPGDGGGVDRVDGEEQGGEPGAGEFEALQDEPEEQDIGGVEADIEDVVAGGVASPEAPLEPTEAVGQGIVVEGFGGTPDPAEAVGGVNQSAVGEQDVVKDEAAVQDGEVGQDCGGHEDEREETRLAGDGDGRWGGCGPWVGRVAGGSGASHRGEDSMAGAARAMR